MRGVEKRTFVVFNVFPLKCCSSPVARRGLGVDMQWFKVSAVCPQPLPMSVTALGSLRVGPALGWILMTVFLIPRFLLGLQDFYHR